MAGDPNNDPEYETPIHHALALLQLAEGADRDVAFGRPEMDAFEERESSLRDAIQILEEYVK